MGGGSGLFWFICLILPASVGIFVAIAKPAEFIAWINDMSERWDGRYASLTARDGVLAGTGAALLWGVHKLHGWTSSIEDEAVRAGIRFGLSFCIVAVTIVLILSLIYLAIVIALIVAGFWVASRVFEDEAAARRRRLERAERLLEEGRDQPLSAREGRSRRRTDWLGNEYVEHQDEEGRLTGRSVVRKDWLGNPYVETRDEEGNAVETSRAKTDWLGRDYVEHRDASDDKIGESREREDWLGREYTEHRDADGTERGRSTRRTDWLGNDYTEHKPTE